MGRFERETKEEAHISRSPLIMMHAGFKYSDLMMHAGFKYSDLSMGHFGEGHGATDQV